MEAGSAILSGTAAEPGGLPASRPGPRIWASVRSWPWRSGAASCFPSNAVSLPGLPAGTRPGGTLILLTSPGSRVFPAGRSAAAAKAATVSAGAGVSC